MKSIPGPIFRLFLAHLVTDLYMPVIAAILPLLISTRGYSYLLAGLLVTTYNLTSSASQPLFGWLSDRKGWQVHISISVLISAVFIGLMGILEPYPLLLACAALAAIGHACFHPHALSIVSRLSTSLNRGRVTSLFVVGGNIGYSLGPILAGAVIVVYGLPGLPILIVPALLMAVLLRKTGDTTAFPTAHHDERIGKPITFATFSPVALLFAASTLRAWAVFSAIAFLPPYFVMQGQDLFSANLLVTLMLLAGVTGQIAGGVLADIYGKKEFVVLGLVCAIPAFFVFLSTSGLLSIIALLLFGFSLWSSFALTVAMAHELMPDHVGLTSGLMLGVSVGAGGLGVAFTGMIADSISLHAALSSIPALIIAALLLMLIVRYPWKYLPSRVRPVL
ncbi:MAG: putative MFS family transporter protein [Methanoregulaceae archaeon PtaU1.Bin222]|nr:MAG: putative MFS family transporter protein [Methanoregulaceae archaeon PtaU1.Bin222]